jgi:putative serine protease PepD
MIGVARAAAGFAAALFLGDCASKAETVAGDPFVRSFRDLRPAVVLLTMKVPSEDKNHPGALDDAYGSGLVVASDARGSRILTAEHVIHDARGLEATLDERRTVPARVVAADADLDLAVVAVAVPNRTVGRLGSTAHLEPGTAIGVAGYPIPDAFSDEKLVTRTSVYAGRISSIRNDSLELDLPVIPGESGGPVFEAATGDVVALAESRFDDEKAIGFGIPIEDAERFLRRTATSFETR